MGSWRRKRYPRWPPRSCSHKMSSAGRAAALWGPDHETLGEVEVREVTASLAMALSRGKFPKGYPHVDLNEDGALAATNGPAAVLAVADGHNGLDAARAAREGPRG